MTEEEEAVNGTEEEEAVDDGQNGSDESLEAIEAVSGAEEDTLEKIFAEGQAIPIMPVRGTVIFPGSIHPLRVGRVKSLAVVKHALEHNRVCAVFMQRVNETEEPGPEELHEIGTLAVLLRMQRTPEGPVNVLLHGVTRVRRKEVLGRDPFITATLERIDSQEEESVEAEALIHTARQQLERLRGFAPAIPPQVLDMARVHKTPGSLADLVASLIDLDPPDAQTLLDETQGIVRLRKIVERLEHQLQVLTIGKEIREQVQESIGKRQQEAILREQLEAIQERLGETDDAAREIAELEEKLSRVELPEEARREVTRELQRLGRIPTQSPEHNVTRTYLEWMADLPWSATTEDQLDLRHAQEILDQDHYGLEDIKDRIVEHLAVLKFRRDARAPILCFVGPPGTGKTSLGRSIARALGRNFVRQSLGGVRDEAEIRGHRRTYVGAMPGKLIQALRRAESKNPVIVLDEIDKVGRDFRGDPYSALLEVLDPAQNQTFVDHYLNVPFDLSRVLFICTANMLDPIPPPLRDRMEVIELSGYTPQEKLIIAKRHLIPKDLADLGLDEVGIEITDEAIELLISGYTRDAGLRSLERQIGRLLRKTARALGETADEAVMAALRRIDPAAVRRLLGHPRYAEDELPALDEPGSAFGLAWTPVGGEVLVIEAIAVPGKRGMTLTGQLGDVMKESVTAAMSWVRANADVLGVDREKIENSEVHLHVPAGAIPKDGPSAGVAMCAALVSLFTGRLARPGVTMTGEITLRGRVLPIGGVKQKVLGAHRQGIRTVILPKRNEHDLDEVPEEVRAQMRFVLVEHVSEVLEEAILPPEQREREMRDVAAH